VPARQTIPDFLAARDDVDGSGAKQNSNTFKGPVTSPAAEYQHSVFLQAGCPCYCPTNTVRALKANYLYCKKMTMIDRLISGCYGTEIGF